MKREKATVVAVEEGADLEWGAHCPHHGTGPNKALELIYDDGDADIVCWCGHHLAYRRDGKLYVREEVMAPWPSSRT